MKARLTIVSSLMLVTVLGVGCGVSKKLFGSSMDDVNTRVDGIQGTVEQQGEAIDDVKQKSSKLANDLGQVRSDVDGVRSTSEQALNTANDAKSMAESARGKVLWQVTLTNRDVNFGLDRFELTADAVSKLESVVNTLRGYDKMVFIEIQGHTDSSGAEAYNQALGLKRANAVRNYLHEQGIPLNLIEVISYGESRPVADNSTRQGRSANRRVEVLVLE